MKYLFSSILVLFVTTTAVRADPDYAFFPGGQSVVATNIYKYASFEGTLTVTNLATPSATSLTMEFWARQTSSPFTEYRLKQNANLGAGKSYTAQFMSPTASDPTPEVTRYFYPTNLLVGEYDLYAVIDPDQLRTDSDRSNNTSYWATVYMQPTRDITFDNSQTPLIDIVGTGHYLDAGSSLTVKFRYKNVGQIAEIPSFLVDYYLIPESNVSESHLGTRYFSEDDSYFLARRTAPGLTIAEQLFPAPGYITFEESMNLPAGLPEVEYYVGVVLNPEDEFREPSAQGTYYPTFNRNDDFSTETLTVSYVYERPDYKDVGSAYQSISPTTVPAGGTVTFSGRITNDSAYANSSWSLMDFSLARLPAANPKFSLGKRLMPNIPANSVYDFSHEFEIPGIWPVGEYVFEVIIDTTELVPERYEDNNRSLSFGISSLTISAPQIPDLWAWYPRQLSPSETNHGGTVDVQMSTWNRGAAAPNAFDVVFVLSVDEEIGNGDDIPFGTNRVSVRIGTNEIRTINTSYTLPGSAALDPGAYYVGATVDASDEVDEFNEENNVGLVSSTPLTITPAGPTPLADIYATEVNPSPTVVAFGSTHTLDILMSNDGSASVPGYKYSVYLSPDMIAGNADDIYIGGGTAGFINSGDEANELPGVTLPGSGIPAGPYYIVTDVDDTEDIDEENEVNNLSIFLGDPLTLTSGSPSDYPALELVKGSLGPTPLPRGATLSYGALVANNGGTNALGVIVEAIISTNLTIGDADDILVATHGPDLLGAGASTTYVNDVVLPTSLSNGSHILAWVVDPDDLIFESSTADNMAYEEFGIRSTDTDIEIVEILDSYETTIGIVEPETGVRYTIETSPHPDVWQSGSGSVTGDVRYPLLFDVRSTNDLMIFRYRTN